MKIKPITKRNWQCTVEFEGGKSYTIINRTEHQAKQMYNRYMRDWLILRLKKVEYRVMRNV